MRTLRVLAVLAVCILAGVSEGRAQAPAPAAAKAEEQKTVVLRLKDNTLLVGRVVREEGDSVVFDAGTLGTLTIKKSDIAATMDPATVMSAFQSHEAAPPPEPSMAGFAPKGKVNWTRVVTFGGSVTSPPFTEGQLDPRFPGLTGAVLKLPGQSTTFQGQVTIVRASERGVAFFDGSMTYAFFEPFGKQSDIPKVSFGYNFRIGENKYLFGVTRFTYYEDMVKKVDYSNQLLGGLGIHAVNNAKLKLDVVPGLAAFKEDKNTTFDDEWLAGWGFLEQLQYNPYKFGQIEQRILLYQAMTHGDYHGLEEYVGFKGMLSKSLGVSIGLTHIYDNVVAQQYTTIPANSLFAGQPALNVLANNAHQVFTTFGVFYRF